MGFKYRKGQKVIYTGSGFQGFDKNNKTMEYCAAEGSFGAMVSYSGRSILVRNDEIAPLIDQKTSLRVYKEDQALIKREAVRRGIFMQDLIHELVASMIEKDGE